MSAPSSVLRLIGTDAGGAPVQEIPAQAGSFFSRTLGLGGDSLVVLVKREDWPPAGAALGARGRWTVQFGDEENLISLGGYVVMGVEPVAFGIAPDAAPQSPDSAQMLAVRMMTWPGVLRNGRGGTVREGTLNRAGPDGVVQNLTDDPDRKSNSWLIQVALASLGESFDAPPASVDLHEPPTALDWGNARAIPEVEGLLARIGHAAALSNDGGLLKIVRLPKGGEAFQLSGLITQNAEPYELQDGTAVRAERVVVSSGATRAVAVSELRLADVEWVAFDDRTGRWLNTDEWQALYADEPHPTDIEALRAGPGREAATKALWERIYSACRPIDAGKRRLANMPRAVEIDGQPVARAAAIAYCRRAEQHGPFWRTGEGQGGGLGRITGVRVHPSDGVVQFPTPLFKFAGAQTGPISLAAPLSSEDFNLYLCHELITGDILDDYFIAAYEADGAGGASRLTDETLIREAQADPATAIVTAQFLRRFMIWEHGQESPAPQNDEELLRIADSIALARVGSDLAKSGSIELRGLHDIAPGDEFGYVSRVTWDLQRRRTVIDISQHEAPQSELEAREVDARRSFAGGVSRFSLPGSSAARSDVRQDTIGQLLNNDLLAGRAGMETAEPAAPLDRTADATTGERRSAGYIMAALQPDAEQFSANRWRYAWTEVFPLDTPGDWGQGTRSSEEDGPAFACAEWGNSGGGVQGNGVNVDGLPDGFAMVPLGPHVVVLFGPLGPADEPWWAIVGAANSVDGECSGMSLEGPAPAAFDEIAASFLAVGGGA